MDDITNVRNDKKEYFFNIDFFRFIFIMSIALCHSDILLKGWDIPLFDYILKYNKYSARAVELFFIISGFFLFYTMNVKQNFYQFVKHKLIRFMPVLLFGLGLYYVFSWFTPLTVSKYDNIWALFLLHNIGITKNYASVGASWFVSCLFWISCLFFYMYKNIKKEYFNLIISLTVVFCASYMIHSKSIGTVFNYDKFLNAGMIRALMSMGIGYFIWNFYCDKLSVVRNMTLSISRKIIITGLEVYCTVFIIKNLLFKSTSYSNYLILILLFSILFILLLIKQGYISKFLDNVFFGFLGKYTYSIMLTHETFRSLFYRVFNPSHKYFITNHPSLYLIVIFSCYITVGIFTYHLVEKPATKYLKKHFEKKSINV